MFFSKSQIRNLILYHLSTILQNVFFFKNSSFSQRAFTTVSFIPFLVNLQHGVAHLCVYIQCVLLLLILLFTIYMFCYKMCTSTFVVELLAMYHNELKSPVGHKQIYKGSACVYVCLIAASLIKWVTRIELIIKFG